MFRILPACLLTFLLTFLLAYPAFAQNSPPPEPEAMKSLFAGKDLEGWDGEPKLWSVKEGVIRGETTKENPAAGNTFLVCTAGEYSDFDLRLMFRLSATNNSGIQYRSRHIKDGSPKNAWVVRGYQHELRNEVNMPNVSGFIYDEGGKRQRVCLAGEKAIWKDGKKEVAETLITPEDFKKLMKLDDWNDVVIRVEKNHIRHYLNDRLILEFTDEDPAAPKSGIIALQLHGGAPMWAEFKNIRIKSL